MKLFLAQIEKYDWKPLHEYEYGEVSDNVMGKILVMDIKWRIYNKKYTMQSLLDSMTQGDPIEHDKMKKEWTNDCRKPKDVLFCGCYRSIPNSAIVMKWDYTDEYKERQKKKAERMDRKLKEELEAIRQKKQKGGKR